MGNPKFDNLSQKKFSRPVQTASKASAVPAGTTVWIQVRESVRGIIHRHLPWERTRRSRTEMMLQDQSQSAAEPGHAEICGGNDLGRLLMIGFSQLLVDHSGKIGPDGDGVPGEQNHLRRKPREDGLQSPSNLNKLR